MLQAILLLLTVKAVFWIGNPGIGKTPAAEVIALALSRYTGRKES